MKELRRFLAMVLLVCLVCLGFSALKSVDDAIDNPNIQYGTKVRVTAGFYEGMEGVAVSVFQTPILPDDVLVRFDFAGIEYISMSKLEVVEE